MLIKSSNSTTYLLGMRSFGYIEFNSWKSNHTTKEPLIIWLFQQHNFRPLDAVLKLSHLQGLLTKLTISVSLAIIPIEQKTTRMTLCCMSLYPQAGTCPTWPRTVVEATPTLLVTVITSITSSKRSPTSPYLVRCKEYNRGTISAKEESLNGTPR